MSTNRRAMSPSPGQWGHSRWNPRLAPHYMTSCNDCLSLATSRSHRCSCVKRCWRRLWKQKKARRLSLLAIPSNYWLDLIATLHIYRSAKLIRIKKQKLIKARKLAQLDQSAWLGLTLSSICQNHYALEQGLALGTSIV